MSGLRVLVRPLRVSVVAAVLGTGVIGLGAAQASATASGVFLACGYASTTGAPAVKSSGCTTLAKALTAAVAAGSEFGASLTVELMPGLYCPLVLPFDADPMQIIGVGQAGIAASGDSYKGPEAGLSTFVWKAGTCGATPPSSGIAIPSHGNQLEGNLTLENLAVASAAGGPANGLSLAEAPVGLRDVLVKGFSGTGLSFSTDYSGYTMSVEDSAFLSNGVGISDSGVSSIDESTVAGNTEAGLDLQGTNYLDNDTISDNGIGVDLPGAAAIQADNSIVGDNSEADCAGQVTSDWEFGGAGNANGNNLVGSDCQVTDLASDIELSDALAAPALNGGPTPTVLPPAQAIGAAVAGICDSTGSDQREYRQPSATCDIGSVNTSANGTAAPASSWNPITFGDVPINQPAEISTTLYNTGGGLLGTSSVTVSGKGFALTGNACTYTLLVLNESGECTIVVTAKPATQTPITGTLTVHTTAGVLDVPLTATGAPPLKAPGAPTGIHGTAGNGRVSLSWTAPTSDGGQPIESYAIRSSTNGGSSWKPVTRGFTTSDTSATITHLTNGKSYLFEVAATTEFATGSYSAKSASLKPLGSGDASVLSAATSAHITAGKSTTLSTTLTDTTDHGGIAAVKVILETGTTANATGAGPTFTTNSQGVATATVHPKVNTRYVWVFGGSTGHSPAVSAAATVSVAAVVQATLSASHIKRGTVEEIYGTIDPTHAGVSMTLQRLVDGKWKTLRVTAKTKRQKLPNHKKVVGYVLSYTPTKSGKELLRVSCQKTSSNTAGASPRLKLTVT